MFSWAYNEIQDSENLLEDLEPYTAHQSKSMRKLYLHVGLYNQVPEFLLKKGRRYEMALLYCYIFFQSRLV